MKSDGWDKIKTRQEECAGKAVAKYINARSKMATRTTVIKQVKDDKGRIVSAKRIRTVPASRLIADLEKEIKSIGILLKDEMFLGQFAMAAKSARNTLKRVISMIKSY